MYCLFVILLFQFLYLVENVRTPNLTTSLFQLRVLQTNKKLLDSLPSTHRLYLTEKAATRRSLFIAKLRFYFRKFYLADAIFPRNTWPTNPDNFTSAACETYNLRLTQSRKRTFRLQLICVDNNSPGAQQSRPVERNVTGAFTNRCAFRFWNRKFCKLRIAAGPKKSRPEFCDEIPGWWGQVWRFCWRGEWFFPLATLLFRGISDFGSVSCY